MGRRAGGSSILIEAVGPSIQNGFDQGGARNYPWSESLAITPPAYYSDYLGSANGALITPPVAALSGTQGSPVGGVQSPGAQQAISNPFGSWSPLPWVILGLIGATFVLYRQHYK